VSVPGAVSVRLPTAVIILSCLASVAGAAIIFASIEADVVSVEAPVGRAELATATAFVVPGVV